MYSEYLGKDYVKRIRRMIGADETLLPNSIVNADLNIGGVKLLIAPVIEEMQKFGKFVDDKKKYDQLQSAAINYLAGILCLALKSRTSSPPYDAPEYKRNWDKKREKFMRYANAQLMELMKMG